MMSIRKLLSRKFNIVCLNLAGLLTRVLPTTFPPLGSGFEVMTSTYYVLMLKKHQCRFGIAYSCGNSSGFAPDSLLIMGSKGLP